MMSHLWTTDCQQHIQSFTFCPETRRPTPEGRRAEWPETSTKKTRRSESGSVTGPSKCGAMSPQPGPEGRCRQRSVAWGSGPGGWPRGCCCQLYLRCAAQEPERRAKCVKGYSGQQKTPLSRKSNSGFSSFAFGSLIGVVLTTMD